MQQSSEKIHETGQDAATKPLRFLTVIQLAGTVLALFALIAVIWGGTIH